LVRELHVIDTGPGMDTERLERIFEPYFTTKSGGTGLGLPTTRRLVEAHGGRIEAHSEPGRGTDFVLTLPALELED
ncbi:MAG: ATP-binding protein, partial [Planctomycetota bacterium]